MTTAWAHLMRGEWFDAVRANAGGALLWLLAVVAAPWLLASAIRGRWLLFAPGERTAAWVGGTVLLVTVIDWTVRVLVHWR